MGSLFIFALARPRLRGREFLSIGTSNKFSCKCLCKITNNFFLKSVDKTVDLCYNNYGERERDPHQAVAKARSPQRLGNTRSETHESRVRPIKSVRALTAI